MFLSTKVEICVSTTYNQAGISKLGGRGMGTSAEYAEFVCSQIRGMGEIRCKRMFGEYMVYVNEKPILLVCDNTVFVKKLDCITEEMKSAETGCPYTGAKEHYILDIEDRELCERVISLLEKETPLPEPKKKAKSGV